MLYCVLKLCTVISTHRRAVLTFLWIMFCHTGPISLCIDSFVFICVNFVCLVLYCIVVFVVLLGVHWVDMMGLKPSSYDLVFCALTLLVGSFDR